MDESLQTDSDVDVDKDEETLLLDALKRGKYAFLKLLDRDVRIGKHAHTQTDAKTVDRHVIEAPSEALSQQVVPLVDAHILKSGSMEAAVTETLAEFCLPSREWLEEHSKAAQAGDPTLTEDSCSEAKSTSSLVDAGLDPMWPPESELLARSRLIQTESDAHKDMPDASTQTSLASVKCNREVEAQLFREYISDAEELTDEAELHARELAEGSRWFLLYDSDSAITHRSTQTETEANGTASSAPLTDADDADAHQHVGTTCSEAQTEMRTGAVAELTQTEERLESRADADSQTDLLLPHFHEASTETAEAGVFELHTDTGVREAGVHVAIAFLPAAPPPQPISHHRQAACQTGTRPEWGRSAQDTPYQTEYWECVRDALVQTQDAIDEAGTRAHLHSAHTQTDADLLRLVLFLQPTDEKAIQTDGEAGTSIELSGVTGRGAAGGSVTKELNDADTQTEASLSFSGRTTEEVQVQTTLTFHVEHRAVGVQVDLLRAAVRDNARANAAVQKDHPAITMSTLPPFSRTLQEEFASLRISAASALLKTEYLHANLKLSGSGNGSAGVGPIGTSGLLRAGARSEERSVEADLRLPVDAGCAVTLVPGSALYPLERSSSTRAPIARGSGNGSGNGNWASSVYSTTLLGATWPLDVKASGRVRPVPSQDNKSQQLDSSLQQSDVAQLYALEASPSTGSIAPQAVEPLANEDLMHMDPRVSKTIEATELQRVETKSYGTPVWSSASVEVATGSEDNPSRTADSGHPMHPHWCDTTDRSGAAPMLLVRAETEARKDAESEFPDVPPEALTAPEVDLIEWRDAGPPLEPASGTSGSGSTHGSENERPVRIQIPACDSVDGPLSLQESLSPSKMKTETSAKEAEAESAMFKSVSRLLMAAPKTRSVPDILERGETGTGREVTAVPVQVRWSAARAAPGGATDSYGASATMRTAVRPQLTTRPASAITATSSAAAKVEVQPAHHSQRMQNTQVKMQPPHAYANMSSLEQRANTNAVKSQAGPTPTTQQKRGIYSAAVPVRQPLLESSVSSLLLHELKEVLKKRAGLSAANSTVAFDELHGAGNAPAPERSDGTATREQQLLNQTCSGANSIASFKSNLRASKGSPSASSNAYNTFSALASRASAAFSLLPSPSSPLVGSMRQPTPLTNEQEASAGVGAACRRPLASTTSVTSMSSEQVLLTRKTLVSEAVSRANRSKSLLTYAKNAQEVTLSSTNAPNPVRVYVNEANLNSLLSQVSSSGGSHQQQQKSSESALLKRSLSDSREGIDLTGRGGESIRESKLIQGGPVCQKQKQAAVLAAGRPTTQTRLHSSSTDSRAAPLASGGNGPTYRPDSLQPLEVFTEDDMLTFDSTSDAPSPYSRRAATMSGDRTRIAIVTLITPCEPATPTDGGQKVETNQPKVEIVPLGPTSRSSAVGGSGGHLSSGLLKDGLSGELSYAPRDLWRGSNAGAAIARLLHPRSCSSLSNVSISFSEDAATWPPTTLTPATATTSTPFGSTARLSDILAALPGAPDRVGRAAPRWCSLPNQRLIREVLQASSERVEPVAFILSNRVGLLQTL